MNITEISSYIMVIFVIGIIIYAINKKGKIKLGGIKKLLGLE